MTNRDQINRLKEPYRSQAMQNTINYRTFSAESFLSKMSISFPDTLWNAFYNGFSNRGFNYWDEIYNNYKNYLTDETES